MNIRGSIAIIVAAVVIIAALAYLVIFQEPKGITAMEAVELANIPAKEWNENSELFLIIITDFTADPNTYPDGKNGRYDEWFCSYAVLASNGTPVSSIGYKVCSNGTVIQRGENNNASTLFELDNELIINWTIDSDKAYDIAMNDEKVQSWLRQHPESNLNMFNLNHMDMTTWHIFWIDKSGPYATYLSIGIIADTGEITLVIET